MWKQTVVNENISYFAPFEDEGVGGFVNVGWSVGTLYGFCKLS